jgi:hypothetical protein
MPARPTLSKALNSTGRRQRGVAAVELALVIPVLVLLSLGVAELGRLIYTYNTMLKAVHSAARLLAMSDHLTNLTEREAVRGEALNLALYGDMESQDAPLVPGLTASMVRVCTIDVCPDHIQPTLNYVSVRITGYRYPSMFTVLLPAHVSLTDVSSTLRGRL